MEQWFVVRVKRDDLSSKVVEPADSEEEAVRISKAWRGLGWLSWVSSRREE